MDLGGEVFSMNLALKLHRVAPSTTAAAEATALRLSDVPHFDNTYKNVRHLHPNLFVVFLLYVFCVFTKIHKYIV